MESFEEQAITTSSYEPRIWKRYVDDTFTILDRENVDDFLQHLNNQQPSIRFTMETEKDNKLAFLDTAVLREPDGRLTTSVYRKPTHTDQYLAYDSHHPQSVKRGIVKCLYERAKRLVTKPSVISEEKKYLSSVLVSNGYPFSLLKKLTRTGKPNNSAKPASEFKATAVKERDRDIRLAHTETSAVSEHAHNTGHKPRWNEVKFIDRDPYYYTRRVKEAII